MATREQIEQEAEERYPTTLRFRYADGSIQPSPHQASFIAGRTVTAEQVEAAAMTMHNLVVDTMWGECASEKEADMSVMRAAFRAAGFYIEGEE